MYGDFQVRVRLGKVFQRRVHSERDSGEFQVPSKIIRQVRLSGRADFDLSAEGAGVQVQENQGAALRRLQPDYKQERPVSCGPRGQLKMYFFI